MKKELTMIRKYIWYIWLAAAAVMLSLSGCVKDNGNYDYRTLTPIEIDMGLNSSTVVARQLERLKIEPKVSQGGSDENLTYRWQLKDNLWVPDPALGYFIDSLLSTDRVLDITVDLPARDYHLIPLRHGPYERSDGERKTQPAGRDHRASGADGAARGS